MTPSQIILLNGASSAGKTSIRQALQGVLDAPYLNLGIDQFISTQATVAEERRLWDEVISYTTPAGPLGCASARGRQIVSSMHHAIAALARAGNQIIAEHLLIEPLWLRECVQLLGELPVWLVGVHCSLEELEAREQARANRSPGQARAQVVAVHTPGVYDLEVDTSFLSPEACALQIKQRLQVGPPPMAMHWLKAWSDPAKQRGWLRR